MYISSSFNQIQFYTKDQNSEVWQWAACQGLVGFRIPQSFHKHTQTHSLKHPFSCLDFRLWSTCHGNLTDSKVSREPGKKEGPHYRRRLNQLLLLDHLLLDLLLDHLLDLLDHLLHNLRLPHIPLILFLAHPFLATSKLKITLSRIFLHPVRQYFHHPVRHSAHSPPGKPLHYCRPAPSLFCCPEFPRRPAGHPHLPIESPRAPKVPDGRRLKAPELPRFARSGRAASIREVLRVWIFFRSQLDAFNCNAVSFLMHAVVHCIYIYLSI